jgi:hypothetical protein
MMRQDWFLASSSDRGDQKMRQNWFLASSLDRGRQMMLPMTADVWQQAATLGRGCASWN